MAGVAGHGVGDLVIQRRGPLMGTFASSRLHKKLAKVSAELQRMRAEEVVVREQTMAFEEEEDYNSLRAVVSEDPFAGREYNEASKDATAFRGALQRTQERIASLEKQQDELLDKLARELR
jgi:alkylated DNA repair dioxygenase AlkB